MMLLELKFKPRYLCVGVYWRKVRFAKRAFEYDVYVFLIPMLALHFRWVEVKSRFE